MTVKLGPMPTSLYCTEAASYSATFRSTIGRTDYTHLNVNLCEDHGRLVRETKNLHARQQCSCKWALESITSEVTTDNPCYGALWLASPDAQARLNRKWTE